MRGRRWQASIASELRQIQARTRRGSRPAQSQLFTLGALTRKLIVHLFTHKRLKARSSEPEIRPDRRCPDIQDLPDFPWSSPVHPEPDGGGLRSGRLAIILVAMSTPAAVPGVGLGLQHAGDHIDVPYGNGHHPVLQSYECW
jgi:hypothetical protein